MYQPIIDALRRGAASEALAAAREAVAAQPEDATSHRLLAAALRLDGDREGSVAAIDQAIALAPDDANLHLERAGLLLQERQLDEAQAALARAVGLDPNQFPAYIVQAQLALGRGDLDEAERIVRIASRIAPDHPHVSAVEGTLALRRGDADKALGILSRAAERAPDDAQLRHSLGFAYLAKGHLAFAEQAFRRLLEANPSSRPLRALVADIVARQGRPAEAADELAPLLEGGHATPALQVVVGELELAAGRNERALAVLRPAFAAQPEARRPVVALCEAWRRLGAEDEARDTLDTALTEHPQAADLWHARLLFEPFAEAGARNVVERWLQAMPESIQAMQAMATIHQQAGEAEQAEAIAWRITELEPGHTQAEMRVVDHLMQRDPEGAVSRVESLISRAPDAAVKRNLRQLLGRVLDNAGHHAAAAETWVELQAEAAPNRLPLPPTSTRTGDWPELAPLSDAPKGVLLLWGLPGSLVERVAVTFDMAAGPLRADRFASRPPNDLFQRYDTVTMLDSGAADGEALVSQWRDLLPSREIQDGNIFDWLLFWDNAMLRALRPHLGDAVLMAVIRDPRDMLLDWLAFGAPAPFALESPVVAARWMAQSLEQLADLHEQNLYPHRLIKLDEIADQPMGIGQAIADALQISIAAAPQQALGPQRFEPGHWRKYAGPLAEAFALLSPVAQRMGYPAA
ncbi:tetratricopeptide repeat protein [Lysobacter niastensis]|uniref:Tetratricopeptide repeat protein n=1 Tax=Lysobacter niastensis TaxID=380629 RepID=A0ABS0B3U0_9GAMM|nr:tetratricopeptide repeat protein [Lysobacter niastensis]MBF6023142.1 tetratricopeptide repeat protein [Lysobacter niastensis]